MSPGYTATLRKINIVSLGRKEHAQYPGNVVQCNALSWWIVLITWHLKVGSYSSIEKQRPHRSSMPLHHSEFTSVTAVEQNTTQLRRKRQRCDFTADLIQSFQMAAEGPAFTSAIGIENNLTVWILRAFERATGIALHRPEPNGLMEWANDGLLKENLILKLELVLIMM